MEGVYAFMLVGVLLNTFFDSLPGQVRWRDQYERDSVHFAVVLLIDRRLSYWPRIIVGVVHHCFFAVVENHVSESISALWFEWACQLLIGTESEWIPKESMLTHFNACCRIFRNLKGACPRSDSEVLKLNESIKSHIRGNTVYAESKCSKHSRVISSRL
jgi:hypothetical protein